MHKKELFQMNQIKDEWQEVDALSLKVGADGARDRRHLHPLYEAAVIAIENQS